MREGVAFRGVVGYTGVFEIVTGERPAVGVRLLRVALSEDPLNLIRLIPAKGGTGKSNAYFFGPLLLQGLFLCNTVKGNMAKLKINGADKSYSAEQMPVTLAELLVQMKIDAATVVAEVDGVIVPREAFGTTTLADGMVLELVRFVPGG